MSRLTVAAWALVGVGLVCVAVGFAVPTAPSSLMPKCTESEVLGIVLFLALWVLGCILLGMVESMKKKYDLVTYRDIVAYSRGEEPVDVYKRQLLRFFNHLCRWLFLQGGMKEQSGMMGP